MNKRLTKVPMREQEPQVRNQNFEEVSYGYSVEEAMAEADRCLNCKTKPCVDGCPVNVPIPEFIEALSEWDVKKAYEILTSENRLPAICGRVCPQEKQCESKCVRGKKGEPVAIGRLERFVADYYMKHYDNEEIVSYKSNGIKQPSSAVDHQGLPVQLSWQPRAMKSPYLKPFTNLVVYWYMAFLNLDYQSNWLNRKLIKS